MKKQLLNFAGIALAILFSVNLFAQTSGTFTFSFTPVTMSPGYTGTKNVLAVWIQTSAGAFVKTKIRYAGGGTSDHLPTWSVNAGGTAGNCLSAPPNPNVTDATTGATLASFTAKTITWDGKNVSGTANGTLVADGAYKITIQETWNHGTGGTVTTSFPFTKGPAADHQTPANTANFTNIKLDWVPIGGASLTVATSVVNVKCRGGNTGSATATPTGTPAYTYTWSTTPAQNTATATGLAAGTYTVTVKDANGTATSVATITQPATALTSTVTNTNANCGSSNATASVSASGGTTGYTYLWSNGKTTASITGLAANSYSVTVTDANGCTSTGVANVLNTGAPTASAAPTNVTGCFGGANGSATVTASGGTGTLTYSWNTTPAQNSATATGLAAGTYTATVTDASGCVVHTTATISQPTAIAAPVTATNASSCSASDGNVTSNVSGGTPPYTYLWSPSGGNAATANNLATGTYSLTVTDSKGCTKVSSATVGCGASSVADAGVNSVVTPSGTMCATTFAPSVTMGNFGPVTITTCTINYYVDAPPALTFTWNGSLATGVSTLINLPAVTGVSVGAHTFHSFTSNPNGAADANASNDQTVSTFTVNSTSASIPLVEGFESSATNLPNGWTVYNPDGDAAWAISNAVAFSGSNCIGFNNCDGNGAGVDMNGKVDRFITSAYDLSTATASASLFFDVAYSVLNYKNHLYTDTLVIYSSIDCGTTWNQIYRKGGLTLANNNMTTTSCWAPAYADWRGEFVSLSNLVGQSGVMFAFENRSNWGEWVYLDNINIMAVTGVESVNPLSGFSIYPNPAATSFTIEGASNAETIHYAIYNVVGAEIKTGNILTSGSSFNGKVQVSDISRGLYFIKVSDGKNTWTKKLNVQ